jgi:hypothetical protein
MVGLLDGAGVVLAFGALFFVAFSDVNFFAIVPFGQFWPPR